MVPVNHVARCVVACALYPSSSSSFSNPELNTNITVAHITAPSPRPTFTSFASTLQTYGYHVPLTSYEEWRDKLVEYVEGTAAGYQGEGKGEGEKEPHALLPLYHFVTKDLPGATRAPELEDGNMRRALERDGFLRGGGKERRFVDEEVVGRYVAFLVGVGFLEGPPSGGGGKKLPRVEVAEGMSLRGRGRS